MKNIVSIAILAVIMTLIDGCVWRKPTGHEEVVVKKIHFEEPQYQNEKKSYSYDNIIYKPGKQITYSYRYINAEDEELCFKVTGRKKNDGSHWEYTSCDNDDAVRTVKLTVKPGLEPMISADSTYRQTVIVYNYYTRLEELDFKEYTGVVENLENVWMHPPRYALFKVLQLNPYPYVRLSEKNQKWKWSLDIGSYWGDARWKILDGSIHNEYLYRKVESQYLTVNNEILECEVFQAETLDSSTALVMYFSPGVGFVKLDYNNVDGSKLSLSMLSYE